MKQLVCALRGKRTLEDLIAIRPAFAPLRGRLPRLGKATQWQRKSGVTEDLQILFVGKTGQGKSSTLNALLETKVFATSEVEACTRRMESIEFSLPDCDSKHFLSFADLPGIGESLDRDEEYMDLYRHALNGAHVVVYLVRSDQRDHAADEKAFAELFGRKPPPNLLLAINSIDKIAPLNRSEPFRLSPQQRVNLRARREQLHRIFRVPAKRIVPISATEDVGLDLLARRIVRRLRPFLTTDTSNPEALYRDRASDSRIDVSSSRHSASRS